MLENSKPTLRQNDSSFQITPKTFQEHFSRTYRSREKRVTSFSSAYNVGSHALFDARTVVESSNAIFSEPVRPTRKLQRAISICFSSKDRTLSKFLVKSMLSRLNIYRITLSTRGTRALISRFDIYSRNNTCSGL